MNSLLNGLVNGLMFWVVIIIFVVTGHHIPLLRNNRIGLPYWLILLVMVQPVYPNLIQRTACFNNCHRHIYEFCCTEPREPASMAWRNCSSWPGWIKKSELNKCLSSQSKSPRSSKSGGSVFMYEITRRKLP